MVGSFHESALRQVSAARNSAYVEVVRLNPTFFLANPSSEVERASRGVRSAFERLRRALLVTASTKDDVVGCVDQGRRKGLDPLETRAIIAEALGKTVARVVGVMPVRGLFLCGGDTAYGVCRALGAEALLLKETIETGVVSSTMVGGPHDGLTVVTKGGSVGGDDTILRALDHLGGNG
ncbi:MAG: hypothetical protein A2Z18_06615 [Armatimonadetes bacterium RBG_16_58_9]|nr:MAG: hypothetical protein A2Z18_06615 [Armatimonadetes bacterium RBG_16_58_9]